MNPARLYWVFVLELNFFTDALGAGVFKNDYREIGWFPVERKLDDSDSNLADVFPGWTTLKTGIFNWRY